MKKKIVLSLIAILAVIAFAADPEFSIKGTLDSEDVQVLRQAYRRSGETNLTLKQWAESNKVVKVSVPQELKDARMDRISGIMSRIRQATDEELTAVEKALGM